ncbi:MAG TPA: hypothetical protein VMA95_07100 [Streptosporangiaceae bacterium]|nr:hypothetical protein [Streptosporangiaceae bacterium]
MLDEDAIARLSSALAARAGGYLRNAVRGSGRTCSRCAIPVYHYEHCLTCQRTTRRADLADQVAMLTYAVAGERSGDLLKGYKEPEPDAGHLATVRELVQLALHLHANCAGLLAGSPLSHWAAVPSLPRKPGEHALREIVAGSAPGAEVRLIAAEKARRPRTIGAGHFEAHSAVPADGHVLLLDDTWTTGGHAESAALALKKAGARRVSLLVVARWIKPDFGDNGWFLDKLRHGTYDPAVCPWTCGTCPG